MGDFVLKQMVLTSTAVLMNTEGGVAGEVVIRQGSHRVRNTAWLMVRL